MRSGAHLSDETKARLVALLKQYSTVFSWKPTDRTGVDWQVIKHNLNITPGSNPVKQKKRGQIEYRNRAINTVVADLVNDTYQMLMDKIFADQIGRNIEVYVNDMVVKSCNEETLLHNVEEAFKTLAKAHIKLNPTKCTFGVEEGQFLGYQISKEGILPNPTKIHEFLE